MSFPRLILTTLLAGSALVCRGAEPVKYEAKNRSTFTVPDGQRPPFWPIGWVKATPSSPQSIAPTAQKILLKEEDFKLTSILLGNPSSLAVVNGRSYSEGEFLRKVPGGLKVRIMRIGDGAVLLQSGDQSLKVLLRRPELVPKKPQDFLPDE